MKLNGMLSQKNRLDSLLKLPRRPFGGAAAKVFKGMATIALGSGSGRLIALLAIPFLTRIYAPEDYGVLSVFVAVVVMIAPVLTLRYVIVVPLPRSDGLAMNLMALSALSMLGMTILLSLALWWWGADLLATFSLEAIAPYSWLLMPALVGVTTYEMLSMWATRRKAYKAIAKTLILQSFLGVAGKIGLGLLGVKPVGLLLGQILSEGGGITSLFTRFRGDFKRNFRQIRLSRMRFLAVHFRNCVMYRLPSKWLLTAAAQAPVLFASGAYGLSEAGQLGLATTVIALPVTLFAGTASNAFLGELSSIGKKRPDELKSVSLAAVKGMSLLALLPTLVLFWLGEPLLVMLLGEKWRLAGQLASLLSIYLMFNFIANVTVKVLTVLNRDDIFFKLNLQRLVLVVATFALASAFQFSIASAVLAYSVAMSLHYLATVLTVFFVLNRYDSRREELKNG